MKIIDKLSELYKRVRAKFGAANVQREAPKQEIKKQDFHHQDTICCTR